jgi:N-acetylglutamate synthase-like GNAT family acetyltransferase
MRTRRARTRDAAAIAQLISHYAGQGLLLPRSEGEIREHLVRFLVLAAKGRVLGCLSLEGYGPRLAEIRSLAVDPESRGRGLGARLVEFALAEARRRGIAQVFAVTHAPEFFLRQGFTATRLQSLDQKVERDCSACPKRRSCRLSAVIATLIPERADLAVLGETAHAIPAA